MNNISSEFRKDCPMRHENGNCLPCGGFCTAVNDPICEGLHSAYDAGWYAALHTQMETTKPLKATSEWVNVEDKLPEERNSIFAKLYSTDKWRDTMFRKTSADVCVVREYEDGTRLANYDHTVDGEWSSIKYSQPGNFHITHWMYLPEPPNKNGGINNE